MKLLVLIVFSFFFLTSSINAQDKGDKPAGTSSKGEPIYTIVGVNATIPYFLSAKNSSENAGLIIKLPIKNSWGAEFAYTGFDVPVTEYSVGDFEKKTDAYGTEEYENLRLDILFYLPAFRYLQIKLGVDYYRFVRGEIYDSPSDGTTYDTGDGYPMVHQAKKNLFGVNAGVNIDVPVYSKFFLMGSVGFRYIVTGDSPESMAADFSLGLGYKI
jgi:hypothetical protein